MTGRPNNTEALISLADLAAMAGVSRPAVTNWRRRHADFPTPAMESGAATLFRLSEIVSWMAAHRKPLARRSVEQAVWTALNSVRGIAMTEDSAEVGMAVLGSAAAAAQLGDSVDKVFERMLETDPTLLQAMLVDQDFHIRSAGLPALLDLQILSKPHWPAYVPFVNDVARLALEFGAAAVFEALLVASARGSRGGGQSVSPAGVTQLLTRLFPIRGTVLDFACGQGSFLIAAARAAGSSKIRLVGQDINESTCRLAQVRMLIHGVEAEISKGDSLVGATQSNLEADLILADPPFSMSWNPERDPEPTRWHFGVPPHRSADLAWVQHAISKLRPGGHAVIVTPLGSLFRGGTEAEIRRRLVAAGHVHAVISLPAGLYPGTAIPTAVLVLGSPLPSTPRQLLLIDASKVGRHRQGRNTLEDDDVDRIVAVVHSLQAGRTAPQDEGIDFAAIPIERLVAEGCNLLPSRWTEELVSPNDLVDRIRNDARILRQVYETSPLDDLAVPTIEPNADEIPALPGARIAVRELGQVIAGRVLDSQLFGTGTTPVIRAMDIRRDFTVTPSETIDLLRLPHSVELTEPGDVLVLTAGQIRAAVDQAGGAVVSGSVHILRPRPGVADPTVLAAVITHYAKGQAAGTTMPRISLGSLEIPIIDLESSQHLRTALTELNDRRQMLVNALEALDDLSEALVLGLSRGAVRFAEHEPGVKRS